MAQPSAIPADEAAARQGVFDALERHEGGSWETFQLVEHLAQASAIPIGWGTEQLGPILERMVEANLLARTPVDGVPHYHRYGTIYLSA
jgi:hypothetical protein